MKEKVYKNTNETCYDVEVVVQAKRQEAQLEVAELKILRCWGRGGSAQNEQGWKWV